jgi:hypothetical protein
VSRVETDSANIHALFADPTGPVGAIMERAAFAVENRMKELLLTPGSGRLYTTRFFTDHAGVVHPIGHRPPHRASAPGEPPASDTGRLLSSISHDIRVEDTLVARVGSPLKVAEWLELGTSKMAPRPFARPALDAVRT